MNKPAAIAALSAALACGVFFTASAQRGTSGASKPGKVVTDVAHLTAKVTEIDYNNRTMTLKGPSGNEEKVTVDPSVNRFKEIKKGDLVSVDYMESTAIWVQKPNEPRPASASSSYIVSNPGKKPSGTMVQTHQVTATVEKVNQSKRELVLKGPEGNKETVKVGPAVKRFDEIKKGDHVVAQITQSVAISVKRPGKAS
jgi:hypothetical protein